MTIQLNFQTASSTFASAAAAAAASGNKHFTSLSTPTTFKLKSSTTATATTIMRRILAVSSRILIVMNLLLAASSNWTTKTTTTNETIHTTSGYKLSSYLAVQAVSVQRLSVPDLVVIDQLNHHHHHQQQQQQQQQNRLLAAADRRQNFHVHSQPEAASLINNQDLSESQVLFECLISYDKKRDKNLVVKWHHDDRVEPIYQWIPELNNRQIAPQYRPYIAPIIQQHPVHQPIDQSASLHLSSAVSASTPGLPVGAGAAQQVSLPAPLSNQTQLLEAGFKLIRPSKELGAPPRIFRFNASRTDIGALLASQRERLIHPSMIAPVNPLTQAHSSSSSHQLPLAYRMKGFENLQQQQPAQVPTTISPSMYSTIDYVNVNQQRARQSSSTNTFPWLVGSPTSSLQQQQQQLQRVQQTSSPNSRQSRIQPQQQNGVKLVCDIDQVFPVPEVSIYRLAKLDGSYPDKLAKLDTRIEKNLLTGLYHVQVTSILEDEELQMKYGLNEPVYFECLIALTNLELSKYADNKRSIIYRPGLQTSSPLGAQTSEDIIAEQSGSGSNAETIHDYQRTIFTAILSLLIQQCLSFIYLTYR